MNDHPNTILIVDDDLSITTNLRELFQAAGWTASTASDADTAIAAIKEQAFDVVLLDLRMPSRHEGLDAIEPMFRMRPDLCIIVFTAYGNISLSVDAMRLGAWNFVEKGVDFKLLETLVAQSLVNWRELTTATKEVEVEKERRIRLESTMTLANGVNHHVKNRLTDCGLAVQLAKLQNPTQAVLERLNDISVALNIAWDAVTELYRFGRLYEIEAVPCNAASAIREAVQASLRRRELQRYPLLDISVSVSENIRVCGDQSALSKAYENLVFNAADAIGESYGSIQITEREVDGLSVVKFIDSGSGFSDASLARADMACFTTKGKSNYGNGLTYAKDLANRFGGHLRYGNNSESRGAWVEMALPIWDIEK